MTPEDVRTEWTAFREQSNAEALAAKEGQGALFRLFDRYRSLSAAERSVVDQLIAEQVPSPDETVRFDAVAMIDKFVITSALPALRIPNVEFWKGGVRVESPFE